MEAQISFLSLLLFILSFLSLGVLAFADDELLVSRRGGKPESDDIHVYEYSPEHTSGDNLEKAVAPVNKYSDVLVVCTIDGNVHGVDTNSGEELWSTPLGGSVIDSYNSLDAVKTGAVVPGDDGMLYVYTEEGRLEQYDISIPKLVEMSPLVQTLDNGHSLTIVGERSSSVLSVDAHKGTVMMHSSAKDDEIKMNENFNQDADLVSVGRVDYHVRAFDQVTKKEVWNFTYGHFVVPGSQTTEPLPSKEMVGKRVTLGGLAVSAMFAGSADRGQFVDMPVVLADEDSGNPSNALIETQEAGSSVVHVLSFIGQNSNRQLFASVNQIGKDISYYMDNGNLLLPPPETVIDKRKNNEPKVTKPGDSGIALPYCDPEKLDAESVCPKDMTGPYSVIRPTDERDTSLISGNQESSNFSLNNLTSNIPLLSVFFLILSPLLWWALKRKPGKKVVQETWIDENTLKVGLLTVNLKEVKGKGCHGTVVYSGKLGKRPVAVKRMLGSMYEVANKEIELLIRSDGHPNVVRYFAQEKCRDFVYLALELCTTTMDIAIMERKEHGSDSPTTPSKEVPSSTVLFLQELADAASHLHDLRIVHCDIKPQNILVVAKTDESKEQKLAGLGEHWIPKISDMGLGRKISDGGSSIGSLGNSIGYGASIGLSSMQGAGTQGWRAPELLKKLSGTKGRISERDVASRCGRAVDVFSLGCVFFYAITDGQHPFGDLYERESAIISGSPRNIKMVEKFPEAFHLIKSMISFNQEARPTLRECLSHPFLWDATKKLSFICLLSDRLKSEKQGTANIRNLVESYSVKVIGRRGWWDLIDELFQSDIYSNAHSYNYFSLCDLLRFIRNKRSHLQELQEKDVREITSTPEKFLNEFVGEHKFPNLLMVCYQIVKTACAHEADFKEFLGEETALKAQETSVNWLKSMPSGSKGNGLKMHVRDWYPTTDEWINLNVNSKFSSSSPRKRPAYNGGKRKMMLCKHWERTGGTWCAKGKECAFAHGPIELRHKRLLGDGNQRTWRRRATPSGDINDRNTSPSRNAGIFNRNVSPTSGNDGIPVRNSSPPRYNRSRFPSGDVSGERRNVSPSRNNDGIYMRNGSPSLEGRRPHVLENMELESFASVLQPETKKSIQDEVVLPPPGFEHKLKSLN